jgi:hypothetical protein
MEGDYTQNVLLRAFRTSRCHGKAAFILLVYENNTAARSASLFPQPIDDESSIEAYGRADTKRRNASRLRHLEHRFSIDVQQLEV